MSPAPISKQQRFYLLLLGVSTGGMALCYLFAGMAFAEGFAFGAALAAANQWILRVMLRTMVPSARSEDSRQGLVALATVLVGMRYLLLATIGYVIVKYSGVSVISLLCGCFVALPALLLDHLFESLYGSRT